MRTGFSHLKQISLVLGLLGILLAPRQARAITGITILESIGISIAVGTVLGASTLPFYETPGHHLVNLAYGASIGGAVGLGIMFYQMIDGSPQGELSGIYPDPEHANSREPRWNGMSSFQTVSAQNVDPYLAQKYRSPRSATGPQAWLPLVSLTW